MEKIMRKLPKLDMRGKEEIEQELLELAAGYVPEWKASAGDAGRMLVHIFSEMFGEIIERFNQMPYKNSLYFLNLLGAEMLPARPSGGHAIFELTGVVKEGVRIRKGTRVYGQTNEGFRVPFETENECHAIYNEAELVCQTEQGWNSITVQKLKTEEGTFSGFRMFQTEGENLQVRRLIFTQKYSMAGTGAMTLRIQILHSGWPEQEEALIRLLANPKAVCWEQKTAKGWESVPDIQRIGTELNLEVPACEEIMEYQGEAGRFIACRLLSVAEKDFSFTEIHVGTQGRNVKPDCLYANDRQLPGETILPYGEQFSIYDDFYIGCKEAFSKRGAKIILTFQLSSQYEEKIEETEDTEEFPQTGYRLTRTGLRKKRAIFSASPQKAEEKRFRAPIRVAWEYFNGSGWAALKTETPENTVSETVFSETEFSETEFSETVFSGVQTGKVKISFRCPEDMGEFMAGADSGLFIRARILKISNAFIPDAKYCYPVARNFRFQYYYEDKLPEATSVFLEKDGTVIHPSLPVPEGTELVLYRKTEAFCAAVYLKLKEPLSFGLINLFWHIRQRTEGTGSLLFESYVRKDGKNQWVTLLSLDETEGLAHSGLITLISTGNSEKLCLFGMDGYYLRITRTGKEPVTICPEVTGIFFNAVRLIQQESMEPEYFTAEPGEQNKICELAGKNLLEPEVWVDEWEPFQKETEVQEQEGTELIWGEDGSLLHRWVKWNQGKSLLSAGPSDRIYLAEHSRGRIIFGNGKHGRLPAGIRACQIRIQYRTCLGNQGNLPENSILGVSDPIPFIRSVTGIGAFSGGCAMETVKEAAEGSANSLKYLNRAVSMEDYSLLSLRADRNIARVKVIRENGGLTLILLPKQPGGSEHYFEQIRTNIRHELQQKASAVLIAGNKLVIQEATYVEFWVHVQAELIEPDRYSEVYHLLEERLKTYFHPVTGDFSGEGFEIGKLPPKTKLFHFIKTTNGIQTIKNLTISYFEQRPEGRKELSYEQAMELPGAVPINGSHTIILETGAASQWAGNVLDRREFNAAISEFK